MNDRINERLAALNIDSSEMTDEEKFMAATNFTFYEEALAEDPWYVPGGACNVVTEEEGQGGQEGGGSQEGGETTPTVTEEESTAYDYVYDEASWTASYQNGAIKKYYEAYPSEDLWNESENRAANFNDRHYIGNIDNEAVESDARWESEQAQSVTIGGTKYYMEIFYDFDARDCALYNDVALTESAEKTFAITEISYAHCTHCWAGAVNAPGAKYPWICPHFDSDVNAKIIFRYEAKNDVQPWGDTLFGTGEGHKAWGCASIPEELGSEFLLTDGVTSFDINKFKMILVKTA